MPNDLDQTITTSTTHAMRFIELSEAVDIAIVSAEMPCDPFHPHAVPAVVRLQGSTVPEYESDDLVVIDTLWCAVWQPGLYALKTEDGFVAKRCQPVMHSAPRMVTLLPERETVPASSLDVAGMVVCPFDIYPIEADSILKG